MVIKKNRINLTKDFNIVGHRRLETGGAFEPSNDVNKRHCDDLIKATSRNISNKVLFLDGITHPTRMIYWNNHKITNLTEPVNLHDATTKNFADCL